MFITQLKAWNLRNLESAQVEPHPGLNYLWGANGAGKTTLLESIALLSRGRSFRTQQSSELTGPLEPSFRVFACIRNESGTESRIGLERDGPRWKARVDGQDITQLSQLSRLIPVVVMVPDSHLLVSGPPDYRRRFMDWGLFHVKQGFLDTWKRFSKALKQRNSALKRGNDETLDSLDAVLADYGTRLDQERRAYSDRVSALLPGLLDDLKTRVRKVEIRYHEGWSGPSLLEALAVRRDSDRDRGATGVGPHRADLGLVCDGVPARVVLSRGEQKAFAAALLLAQTRLLLEDGVKPLLLLDDLVSEFDAEHFEIVLDKFLETGCQAWLTGTEQPELKSPHALFHVEQGKVNKMV